MKRISIILAFLFLCVVANAQRTMNQSHHRKVNFGIKGGFNSSMYFVDKFKIQDITINEIQNNYKVGYFGTLFMRINIRKHYIQPELTYNVSKSGIEFDKKGSQHPDIKPEYAQIVSTIRTVELPILYGYRFIKNGPYNMSFFVGPKIKYIWRQKSKLEFSNFDKEGMNEELYPVNLSAIIGLGVGISNILFDFKYEIGLHNQSKSITYDNFSENGQSAISNIEFKRRCNLLSFSLGFIF